MKVAVGLSGGVDSSVAAALLKEQGHEVIAVTMLIWPDSKCCSGKAIEDAKEVAKYLGIEYHIYDLIPEFTKEIVDNFVSEYSNGRTPNPCPTCNYKMKFHYLWNAVRQRHPDIEKIATGHYINIGYDDHLQRHQIMKGKDKQKDQSYMLYKLKQEQLSKMMFPLGGFEKSDVRKMAAKMNLSNVANKEDSMDLCFTSGSLEDFLKERVSADKASQGKVVNSSGEEVGEHKGVVHYTIGQRKGFNVPASQDKLYVLEIKPDNNTIVVGKDEETFSTGLIADEVSWLSIDEPKTPILSDVKVRYLSEPSPAEIIPLGGNRVKIMFKEKQRSITPGQVTVFYSDEILLGGGTITEVIK